MKNHVCHSVCHVSALETIYVAVVSGNYIGGVELIITCLHVVQGAESNPNTLTLQHHGDSQRAYED